MIYLELFLGFLKVGFFAFGGAYAAIPFIRDVVLSYGWLSDDMLSNMIAISESTPGPIMINLATYVGSSQAGILGSLLATLAVILPSFFIIILITIFMTKVMNNRLFKGTLDSVKASVIGIILATGVYMIINNCFGISSTFKIDLRVIALIVILSTIYFLPRIFKIKKISPILLIVISAVFGVITYGFFK